MLGKHSQRSSDDGVRLISITRFVVPVFSMAGGDCLMCLAYTCRAFPVPASLLNALAAQVSLVRAGSYKRNRPGLSAHCRQWLTLLVCGRPGCVLSCAAELQQFSCRNGPGVAGDISMCACKTVLCQTRIFSLLPPPAVIHPSLQILEPGSFRLARGLEELQGRSEIFLKSQRERNAFPRQYSENNVSPILFPDLLLDGD